MLSSLLPKGHILPPSFYLCKKVLAVKDPDNHQYHVCPNLCHCFGHLPRAEWERQKEEMCPECKTGRRFEWSVTATGRIVIEATKVRHQVMSSGLSVADTANEYHIPFS